MCGTMWVHIGNYYVTLLHAYRIIFFTKIIISIVLFTLVYKIILHRYLFTIHIHRYPHSDGESYSENGDR